MSAPPVVRTIPRAELVVRAFTITGESNIMRTEPTEPTVADAAQLVADLAPLGTVARLDRVHAALVEAYRAGQRAEGADLLVALAGRYSKASRS